MNSKYQNGFFLFGVAVLVVMLTQLDYAEVWRGLCHAGYWFFAVLGIWVVLYLFNTAAWWIIIKSQEAKKIREDGTAHYFAKKEDEREFHFLWLYKVTVSGFALNYATPGGLMGGEAYRIMELTPRIGAERASSSVILYVMTHIFSHFWFWLLSIPLFIIMHSVTPFLAIILLLTAVFCLSAIWFFMKGYRKGLAVRGMNILRHVPFLKRWAQPFIKNHKEQLDTIDQQIAALHKQNKRTFFCAVLLEWGCRVCSALEILFVLHVLALDVNFLDCVLILAFTSLFANLLFFIPLQLGGREGGFLMSVTTLGFSTSAAIFVALIIRLRELVWTGIGLLLIKVQATRSNLSHEEQTNNQAEQLNVK